MNLRLKKVRQHFNLSQHEFGKKIFLSQDQISLLEQGKRKITDRTLYLLCETYNINKNWLLTGEGRMFNTSTEDLKEIQINSEIREILELLLQLDQDDQDRIVKIIESFAQK